MREVDPLDIGPSLSKIAHIGAACYALDRCEGWQNVTRELRAPVEGKPWLTPRPARDTHAPVIIVALQNAVERDVGEDCL